MSRRLDASRVKKPAGPREPGDSARRIAAVRQFTRFYTRRLRILDEHLLESDLSLGEARVLYEVAQAREIASGELAATLGLDPSFVSRIVKRLEARGVMARREGSDRRSRLIEATAQGRRLFTRLDRRSSRQVAALLAPIGADSQDDLVAAMATIERVLLEGSAGQDGEASVGRRPAAYVLRHHRPGDIGWVIERHGRLYAGEYDWNQDFETLVAGIAAAFLGQFDSTREVCWIAERDGRNVGSVFVVRESDEVAKLRLLLVEPSARGLGLGARLVEECIRFARERGYLRLVLWTNDCLVAARANYQKAGFRLVREERHHSFGHALVGQYWELGL